MQEYRNISDLRKDYLVVAHFYEQGRKRLFADIIRRSVQNILVPVDAYMVMMNPGSCKPNLNMDIDDTYNPFPVREAVSDRAMKCVMWLLDSCKLDKVRILNLLDMVDPKSKNTVITATNADNKAELLKSSIFSDEKIDDYKKLVTDDRPFIVAWGKDPALNYLKEQALSRIPADRIIGIPYDNISYKYLRPWKLDDQKYISQTITEKYLSFKMT